MSFGGKFDYAKEYAKYKPESTRFGSYVDEHPDLSSAWKRIESDPNHPDSQYWIKRGATSKDAFGRAHAAEDFALKTGDYLARNLDPLPKDNTLGGLAMVSRITRGTKML